MIVPFVTVKAFLLGVSFPTQSIVRDGEGGLAWLKLEDDADCHKFRVAVPTEFARQVERWADGQGGTHESEALRMLVGFTPLDDADPAMADAPTMEQLLAVWNASAFMVDYARDEKLCAVCDGHLPGHADYPSGDSTACRDDCVGRTLRMARRSKP